MKNSKPGPNPAIDHTPVGPPRTIPAECEWCVEGINDANEKVLARFLQELVLFGISNYELEHMVNLSRVGRLLATYEERCLAWAKEILR